MKKLTGIGMAVFGVWAGAGCGENDNPADDLPGTDTAWKDAGEATTGSDTMGSDISGSDTTGQSCTPGHAKTLWVKRVGGAGFDFVGGAIALQDGSFIVNGGFGQPGEGGGAAHQIILGEGEANETMLQAKYNDAGFVARYSSIGELIWAFKLDRNVLDPSIRWGWGALSEDSIVLMGEYEIDGIQAYHLMRYDRDGQKVWSKVMNGEGSDIAVLSDDSFVVAGEFNGIATFGRGEPTETTIESQGLDAFLARYSKDGNLLWVQQAGGTDHDFARQVQVLPDGSIAVAGICEGTAVFGKGQENETTLDGLFPSGEEGRGDNGHLFVAKYQADGQLIWAKWEIKGYLETYQVTSKDLDTTQTGNILLVGDFMVNALFAPGDTSAQILTSACEDFYLARFTGTGALDWVSQAGMADCETGRVSGAGLVILPDDSLVVTGSISPLYGTSPDSGPLAPTTFGRGEPGQTTISSAGGADIFLARYNGDGSLTWVETQGGVEDDWGNVALLTDGSMLMTGSFNGEMPVCLRDGTETVLQSAGSADGFIMQFEI